jgi:hypothetical protein
MRGHVYFFTHLEVPYAAAARLLDSDPGVWLPAPAAATGELWTVDLDADGALPGPLASHTAEVAVGPAAHSDAGLVRTVSWRSAHMPALIPMLAADLELCPLEGDRSRLTMVGRYRPPLSVVGGSATGCPRPPRGRGVRPPVRA